uniref:Putative amino acid transporter n=2 Tax=Lutzomyia longipalpis TaxID=7200 RepID=A0A7G3A9N9_LUTLO
MAWTIPVFVALSTFGAVNGILLTSSRLFYAGACEGQMPEILTMIQIHRMTPTPAVLIMALLSMLYLMSSDIFALINYVGFATWLSIGVSVLCLPWLRWAQPNLPRPIKVNLIFPIVYLLATVFVTVVPMYASPVETGYGVLMISSGVPVYLIFISWKNKPKWFRKLMGALTIILQKTMVVSRPKSSLK